MEKRGLGHVEMIIAFVMFAGAVSAIFYFFDVGNVTRNFDTLGDYLNSQITYNSSVEIEVYTIVLEDNLRNDIISIELKDAVPLDKSIRVENEMGVKIDVFLNNGREIISLKHLDNKKLKMIVSEDIESSYANLNFLPVDNNLYRIGSTERYKVLSEKRILLLNESYFNNYEETKEYFRITPDRNFAFRLDFSQEEFINTLPNIPIRGEVNNEKNRKEAMRKDGSRVFADWTIRLW